MNQESRDVAIVQHNGDVLIVSLSDHKNGWVLDAGCTFPMCPRRCSHSCFWWLSSFTRIRMLHFPFTDILVSSPKETFSLTDLLSFMNKLLLPHIWLLAPVSRYQVFSWPPLLSLYASNNIPFSSVFSST